jgi:GAF domain-containing protein/FHA domain-containing protein
MPARLTVHLPARPARVLVLSEGTELEVGRAPGCGLVLDDDRVSRHHARLGGGDGAWRVTDLGSKNGTAVDGVPVERAELAERNWLSFGGLLARFERVAEGVELAALEERMRRLRTSLELAAGRLDPTAGLEELLGRVLGSTLELVGAERGMILLAQPDGDLEVAARAGLDWSDLTGAEFGGSVGAVERVLAAGEPVVSSDALADDLLGARASVVREGIRALVCLPVKALDRAVGVMYADSRRPGAVFTELDLDILRALASQAGLAVAVARLDREIKGIARLAGADSPSALDATLAYLPGGRSLTWYGLLAARETALPAGR